MLETLIRPVSRQLGVTLAVSAAVLCITTPGFAEPIELSNVASIAIRDLPGMHPIYPEATYRGEGFAILADDLGDWARTALSSGAERTSSDPGRGWTREPIERSDGAGLGNRSVDLVAGTSVPVTIPEPSSLISLGAGLVGAAIWRRRRIFASRSV